MINIEMELSPQEKNIENPKSQVYLQLITYVF